MARKIRPREHVIGDLGVNYVEKQILLCGHAIERTQSDYGIDLVVWTFDEQNELEPGAVKIQVKATDHPSLLGDGSTIALSGIEVRDLRSWFGNALPFILVLYDASRDVGYWLCIQEDLKSRQQSILESEQVTVTVHFSVARVFDPIAVERIVDLKRQEMKQKREERE